ncbi:hypothetical protein PHLCEN_2v1496 [Hermanssonia centrifuga]|uniref:Uncharacterized protein n=1 Tax=Hermanssonia centrifuga TaxID=98765 RepID=A0A2R6RZS8_9APHY|nr:hypothetical protein PHLCEN_2v1496 [Hermanssonia centrifuga]
MAEFLGSIHTPYLHHLAVDETLSQWTEIAVITLLEDISRHVHLQELRICLRRIVTTSFTSIETLFGLTRLRSLSLQGIDFLLENDTIQQFGRAWPTLETFRLDWAPYQGDPSLFTLDALELFAIHLPHLNKITVYLDATHLPPSPSSNYRDVSTIRPDIGVDFSLGVSRSPVKESIATQIAEYIARIYPHANIQSLDFNSSEESKRQNKIWREIDRMSYRNQQYPGTISDLVQPSSQHLYRQLRKVPLAHTGMSFLGGCCSGSPFRILHERD